MTPNKNLIKIREFRMSSEAVAEVLGFVTLLGIMLLSFSLIGLVGYPALRNAQEARHIENSKQSFIVLADNVNKVALGQAPSQNIELKMYGGTLRVGESKIKINATQYNTSTSAHDPVILYDDPLGGIENSIGDTVIAYEGTGVWIRYHGDVVLNSYKPYISNSSNIIVIPIVRINGRSSISGNGLSRVTVCQQQIATDEGGCGTPDIAIYKNVSNVTVKITGNYTRGWEDYFKNMNGWKNDIDGGRLNATNVDVYILRSWIEARIK